MKLTFFANACCRYESDNKQLLTDPWLVVGAFEGSWCHYPPLKTKIEDIARRVDYLYISHIHPDHYDPATLKFFRRDIPIVVLDRPPNFLCKSLNKLGFTNVIKVKHREKLQLGPFALTMYEPFAKHVFHESQLGNLIDSALVVESGSFSILNTNDNTPSLDVIDELKGNHGCFDVVQLNYNAAGPFPSCFDNLSVTEKKEAHEWVLNRNLSHMNDLVKAFEAKYVMPFAGAFVLGGIQWPKNEYLGTTTQDYAAKFLVSHGCKALPILLNEGLTFDLKQGKIINGEYTPTDTIAQNRHIREVFANLKYPHEEEPVPPSDELERFFEEGLPRARTNLYQKQVEAKLFPELNLYLCMEGQRFHFNFASGESRFLASGETPREPYLECRLDPRLLKRILERKAHWNSAEGGCHIDFVRKPDVYIPDVHTLLSFFHLPQETCVAPKQGLAGIQ